MTSWPRATPSDARADFEAIADVMPRPSRVAPRLIALEGKPGRFRFADEKDLLDEGIGYFFFPPNARVWLLGPR